MSTKKFSAVEPPARIAWQYSSISYQKLLSSSPRVVIMEVRASFSDRWPW